MAGKAASRLQEVTGEEGLTIHRLLGYNGKGFTHNADNPLPYDIIILDEVSLVGGEIFLSLIEAIPEGTKLIMLGDLGQLEAVGTLNLAADLFHSSVVPSIDLKKIYRQAAQSGIISSAHQIRHNNQLYFSEYEGIDITGDLKDMCFDISTTSDTILERSVNWYKQWFGTKLVDHNPMNIHMLSPVNTRGHASVQVLNNQIQNLLGTPYKGKQKSFHVNNNKQEYDIFVGDKVMCIQNDYHTIDELGNVCPIYNGWTGMVTYISDEKIIVDFPLAHGEVHLEAGQARKLLVLGYASTVHKEQGSSSPVIIGVIDYSTPPKMLTSQLVYTLLTRAKKRCVLVAQNGALSQAIATDNVSAKRTFLPELLDKVQAEVI